MDKVQKDIERNALNYCGDCGQNITNSDGICTRCDELCIHCNHKEKLHVGVAPNQRICPTSVFSGGGIYGN